MKKGSESSRTMKGGADIPVDYVYRINLKTGGAAESIERIRPKLIQKCLENPNEQYIAIGWSTVYNPENNAILTFDDYYNAVVRKNNKCNAAINIFKEARENSLFWTRDLNGDYWICRAKGPAKSYNEDDRAALDIGAVIPVEAFKYGHEVPGQIRGAFNRAKGGTAQRIHGGAISEFSKYAFNSCCEREHFAIDTNATGDIIYNLPDFELEELVISYIQIKCGYYVLSNSIANKSTTIKIECEFRSRDLNCCKKAVVQVKGGNKHSLRTSDYQCFIDQGYCVFLYCAKLDCDSCSDNIIQISTENLRSFYQEYKSVLPESITCWESLQQHT